MTCEFCSDAGGRVLWRGPECRVVYVEEPGYPGFCRVIWNMHVKEMTDLDAETRARFLHVVFAAEQAVRDLLRPDKVNLACLGNITPHLHWHVIPRFADDPHFPLPIWAARQRPPVRTTPPSLPDALAASLAARLDA